MGIEERLAELEVLTKNLSSKILYLEKINNDKWVSAKELAELMGCSTNNIYIKIRKGDIYATDKLGSIPRIPMSQFYKKETLKVEVEKPKSTGVLSVRERVFGVT